VPDRFPAEVVAGSVLPSGTCGTSAQRAVRRSFRNPRDQFLSDRPAPRPVSRVPLCRKMYRRNRRVPAPTATGIAQAAFRHSPITAIAPASIFKSSFSRSLPGARNLRKLSARNESAATSSGIVSNQSSGCVVVITKITRSGGSSSVFSKALRLHREHVRFVEDHNFASRWPAGAYLTISRNSRIWSMPRFERRVDLIKSAKPRPISLQESHSPTAALSAPFTQFSAFAQDPRARRFSHAPRSRKNVSRGHAVMLDRVFHVSVTCCWPTRSSNVWGATCGL